MKKIVIIALIIFSATALCFSSEAVSNEIQPVTISFQSVFNTGSLVPLAAKNINMESSSTTFMAGASFTSWLKKHNKTFFILAIAMTITTGVSFLLGLTGAILYGVWYGLWFGTITPTTAVTLAQYNGLIWGGQALAGLGWSIFGLALPAMILFWIFWYLGKGKKKSSIQSVVIENGIGFSIKL